MVKLNKQCFVVVFLTLFFILSSIGQTVAEGDVSSCESLNNIEAQICYINQAINSNDVGICNQAPIPDACALNLAHELEDPQPILDFKEAGLDRDLLLASYSTMTLDPSAWELIEDNRIHDGAVIQMPAIAYARLKKAPVDDYCENLRGGYEYDPGQGGMLPSDEILSNKNLCETVVAAMNELVHGGDDCNTRLSGLQPEYEGQDLSGDCKDLVKQVKIGEKRIEEAETLPEIMEILDEINQKTFGEDEECDFSGVWDTNWGEMKLHQSGASVTGTYTWDKGKISGSVTDNVLSGWWSESPSYSPPKDAGSVELTFEDDCSTFSGTWGYGNEERTGTWTGATKVGDIPIPEVYLPPPEELNDDLLESSEESPSEPASVGKLGPISGDVFIRPIEGNKDDWFPVSEGDLIYPTDDIRTGAGGKVRIIIDSGEEAPTIFNVGKNTEIRIGDFLISDKPEKGFIDLIRGTLNVITRGWREGIRVNTRVAAGVVIGSEVIIDYDPDSEIVNAYVIEGHMDVTNNETGEKKSLTDNQKLIVEKGNLGDVQPLSQAEWDNLVEEKGLGLGGDEPIRPETISDSEETPTLISEDTGKSAGINTVTILIALLVLIMVAFLGFKKMRK